MSRDSDPSNPQPDEAGVDGSSATSEDEVVSATAEVEGLVPQVMGVEKYVHAAFFSAGILSAYLFGKVFQTVWNELADWPTAVKSLPFLIQYGEEERGNLTLIVGAVVGLFIVLRYYRRPAVKNWATDVAGELARVTWPSKETVTNGTLVVIIAGAVATVYVALLDRFWGYLTNLVYGA